MAVSHNKNDSALYQEALFYGTACGLSEEII
jgi:hypothetical protein